MVSLLASCSVSLRVKKRKLEYLNLSTERLFLAAFLVLVANIEFVFSCETINVGEQMAESDAVFAAIIGDHYLIDTRIQEKRSLIGHDYETLHVWKGQPGRAGTVGVLSLCNPDYVVSFCSPELDRGVTYLVFATETEHGLITDKCMADYFSLMFSERMELGEAIDSYVEPLAMVTPELLLERLKSYEHEVARTAADMLKNLGMTDEVLAFMLQQDWRCGRYDSQFQNLMSFFDVLKSDASSVIGHFEYFWNCSDPVIRSQWIISLSEAAPNDEMLDIILRGLADEDSLVKSTAAFSARKIEGKPRIVVKKHLLQMLQSENTVDRLSAAYGFRYFYDLSPFEIEALCTIRIESLTDSQIGEVSRHCSNAVINNSEAAKESDTGRKILSLDQPRLWMRVQ